MAYSVDNATAPILLAVIVLLHFLKWNEAAEWLRIQADTSVFVASSAMYVLYELEYGLQLWMRSNELKPC